MNTTLDDRLFTRREIWYETLSALYDRIIVSRVVLQYHGNNARDEYTSRCFTATCETHTSDHGAYIAIRTQASSAAAEVRSRGLAAPIGSPISLISPAVVS
jgi:hypothetical protein